MNCTFFSLSLIHGYNKSSVWLQFLLASLANNGANVITTSNEVISLQHKKPGKKLLRRAGYFLVEQCSEQDIANTDSYQTIQISCNKTGNT